MSEQSEPEQNDASQPEAQEDKGDRQTDKSFQQPGVQKKG